MTEKLDIRWLKVTDSTNNRALEGIPSEKDKTVWAAEFQTAGRGQRGNVWKADKAQNLTFSILLKPDFILAKDQFIVSVIITLGIESYLKKKGVTTQIKWPNDIYALNNKICGILIEHSISGEYLSASVCGIGLNINQRTFPEDLPNPTSLILELEKVSKVQTNKPSTALKNAHSLNLKDELEILVRNIFDYYNRAKEEFNSTGTYNLLYSEYLNKLYRKGEWHNYIETAENKRVEARIIGINENACIILEYRNGTKKAFAFKEIAYVL